MARGDTLVGPHPAALGFGHRNRFRASLANRGAPPRAGVLEKTMTVFKDNAHLMHVIERIVSAIGRHINEASPMVDARLADGSRVNVIIPPLAVDGAQLSIRRFGHVSVTEDDLLAKHTLSEPMLDLLRGAVKARECRAPTASFRPRNYAGAEGEDGVGGGYGTGNSIGGSGELAGAFAVGVAGTPVECRSN